MRANLSKLAFNRGLVSRLGLARADIKRLAFACEVMTNWMTRVLGSMMLRPGWEFLNSIYSHNRAFFIPFVFSVEEKALIELADMVMRVWVNDQPVTRPAVSTTITNPGFDTDVSNWTDADESGATSDWVAGGGYEGLWVPAGNLRLVGNGTAFAIRRQQLAIAGADQGIEHGLSIYVANGPVLLRVGSTSGDDDLINETSLETGEHHICFTPTTASAWVEFKSQLIRAILVNSCDIEPAGVLVSNAIWQEADLSLIRYDQSGDVIFVACGKTTNKIGYQQWRIERRSTNGWSVVLYRPEDGPFRTENVTTITLTASALSGNITITASKPVFKSTHVGALFRVNSIGQNVSATITAQNTFTDPIRVTGTGTSRSFGEVITGLSGTGSTVTLQASFDEGATWIDNPTTRTADVSTTRNDGLDNQIVLFRIGVKTGNYAGGTIIAELHYTSGSITGVARITTVTSSVLVSAEVLRSMGATTATDSWAEGQWSDFRGWPTSVGFHDGRLGWAGRNQVILSISDAFDSFDPDFEGDAGVIQRSIGSGPVDTINWMLSLQRLILGAQMTEFSVRSSSLDEPVTPTNFQIKRAATQGSAPVQGVLIDQNGIMVQRGGVRVFELAFGQSGVDYEATQLSALIPEIGSPGIIRMQVQRQPDTRLHCVRSDGTACVLVFDKVEQVICWLNVETDGYIEDVVILPGDPGDEEDWVYYSVRRTLDSGDVRYLEKWAFEEECHGGQLNKLADSFIVYDGVPATVFPAAHLLGKEVVVWADGADVGTDANGDLIYTVGGGGITLPTAASKVVIGLPYSAPWKSAKMVELMANPGGKLTDTQIIKSLGLLMADVHAKGLKYGTSLVEADMQDLPEIEDGAVVDPDDVRVDYAGEQITFPGEWSNDARLCLLAKAPRPVTILAALADMEHHG